jgi:hypothetical protein
MLSKVDHRRRSTPGRHLFRARTIQMLSPTAHCSWLRALCSTLLWFRCPQTVGAVRAHKPDRFLRLKQIGYVDVRAQVRLGWPWHAWLGFECRTQGIARVAGLGAAQAGAFGAALHGSAATELRNFGHVCLPKILRAETYKEATTESPGGLDNSKLKSTGRVPQPHCSLARDLLLGR